MIITFITVMIAIVFAVIAILLLRATWQAKKEFDRKLDRLRAAVANRDIARGGEPASRAIENALKELGAIQRPRPRTSRGSSSSSYKQNIFADSMFRNDLDEELSANKKAPA